MDGIAVAVIGAAAAVLASFLTHLATRRQSDGARIKALEDRLDAIESKNRLLWRYCQDLILHINAGNGPPAPPWPSGLDK